MSKRVFLSVMIVFLVLAIWKSVSSAGVDSCTECNVLMGSHCLAQKYLPFDQVPDDPEDTEDETFFKEWSAKEGTIFVSGNVIGFRFRLDDQSKKTLDLGGFGLEIEIVEKDGDKLEWFGWKDNLPDNAYLTVDTKALDSLNFGSDTVHAMLVKRPENLLAETDYYVWFYFDSIPPEGVTIQPNLVIDIDSDCYLYRALCSDTEGEVCEYFGMETDSYTQLTVSSGEEKAVCWNDKEDSQECQVSLCNYKSKIYVCEKEKPENPEQDEDKQYTKVDEPGQGHEILPDPREEPNVNPAKPDYAIEKVWLETQEGLETYEYELTQEIKMKGQTKNIGEGDSPQEIENRFYLSKGFNVDSRDKWIHVGTDSIQANNLEVGQTHTETEGLQLWKYAGFIQPGKYYNIVYCADRTKNKNNKPGEVIEEHESNNCSTEAVFYVKAKFNFQNTWLLMQGGNHKVLPNEHFNLDSSFLSAESDAPHDMGITYRLNGEIVHIHVIPGGELKRGMTYSTVISDIVSPQTVGVHRIDACIDPYNEIPETNEEDNCLPLLFEVVDINNPEYPIVQLETQGHIPGPKWLSCEGNQVTLSYDNNALHTYWRYHEPEPGKFAFQCLANDFFLNAVTSEGTLTLSPYAGVEYSGALWELIYQTGISYYLKTLGHIPGPEFLDGVTGSGEVILNC